MPGALVYVAAEGQPKVLDASLTLVRNSDESGETAVRLPSHQGLLLSIPSITYRSKPYTGGVLWTLADTP